MSWQSFGLRIFFAHVLFFALCPGAGARDAYSVGKWLSGRSFCAPGIALALDGDGFFALRMEQAKRPVQNVTGHWRLDSNGIDLTLYNNQDAELKLSVGRDGLHGLFGNSGQVMLLPDCADLPQFRVTGLLEKGRDGLVLTDASSGRRFRVGYEPKAEPGKFAVAELQFASGFSRPGRLVRHSGPVPRFFTPARSLADPQEFKSQATAKYWLIPPDIAYEKAVLRFSEPAYAAGGGFKGNFEVTGRGVRLEGEYLLRGDELTFEAARSELRNLEIIGFGQLAQRLPGQFKWRLSSRGLELSDAKGILLFLAQ